MKKFIFGLIAIGLLSSVGYAKKVEQTICFSQEDTGRKIGNRKFYMATLGDNVTLNGGKCQGKTLIQMNKNGWKLLQVQV